LKAASPWYKSMRDPLEGAGARIPDPIGVPTATLQVVQYQSVAVNAGGVAGLVLASPYQVNASQGQIFTTLGTATTGALALQALAASTTLTSSVFLNTSAQSARVVSCAIFGEYEGTTLQDSGDVTCYQAPLYSVSSFTGGAGNTIASYQTLYNASVIPVNKARTRPVATYWYPYEAEGISYQDFFLTNAASFVRPPLNAAGQSPTWELGIFYTGLPASTGSIRFTIVVNYEYVPALNTLDLLGASPSPDDPTELSLCEGWIEEDPVTGIVANKIVDVAPGARKVDEAEQGFSVSNMFGMIMPVIAEVLPLLL
jgi:hypothetical protein